MHSTAKSQVCKTFLLTNHPNTQPECRCSRGSCRCSSPSTSSRRTCSMRWCYCSPHQTTSRSRVLEVREKLRCRVCMLSCVYILLNLCSDCLRILHARFFLGLMLSACSLSRRIVLLHLQNSHSNSYLPCLLLSFVRIPLLLQVLE